MDQNINDIADAMLRRAHDSVRRLVNLSSFAIDANKRHDARDLLQLVYDMRAVAADVRTRLDDVVDIARRAL